MFNQRSTQDLLINFLFQINFIDLNKKIRKLSKQKVVIAIPAGLKCETRNSYLSVSHSFFNITKKIRQKNKILVNPHRVD